jgi:hypothetical protein
MAERFEAVLDEPHRVEVPLDVRAVFGRSRAPVRCTVNGHTFRTTVATYGGRYYVGFRREIRDAAGLEPGATVTVELELDEAPREVDVPAGLAEALAADSAAQEAFDRLSYTHRNEYARWVAEAKREDTRRARTENAVTMLREGVKHP